MQHDKLHKYVNVKASVNFRVKIKKKLDAKMTCIKTCIQKTKRNFFTVLVYKSCITVEFPCFPVTHLTNGIKEFLSKSNIFFN